MPAAHNTLCMHTPLTFAEILSALSHALDITEGQPRGHAVRTAYLALRIGKELQLPDTDMRDLYKASLLKDAGCSSNAVRVYKVFAADDLLTKRGVKLVNWSNPLESYQSRSQSSLIARQALQRLPYPVPTH